jgi:stage II sporulation protein D
MRRISPLWLLLTQLLWVLGGQAESTIRVGLLRLNPPASVTITPLGFANLNRCRTCARESLPHSLELRANRERILISGKSTEQILISGSYTLSAQAASPLSFQFPLTITAHMGHLTIVAAVPLERYVEAVVAGESASGEPNASLAALAIVARTFATRDDHGHTADGFNLCDTTHCQALRWNLNEQAHQSATSTAAEILRYHGAPAQAYFHQHCGGRTAAASDLWPGIVAPYLSSHEDVYCTRVNRAAWHAEIKHDDITRALRAAGVEFPANWESVSVVARSSSERAAFLRFQPGRTISAPAFRVAIGRTLGWNLIRSDWYELSTHADSVFFNGRGHGHGVGLCQTGAAEMAREGKSSKEILAYYFPGTTVAPEEPDWHRISARDLDLLTTQPSADRIHMEAIEAAWDEAHAWSGLVAHDRPEVRAFPSVAQYIQTTGEPGWIAATTRTLRVDLQPLALLQSKHILRSTLRHEFLHVLVEQNSTSKSPLWLHEGVVGVFDREPSIAGRPTLDFAPDRLDVILRQRTSQKQAQTAHQAAAFYARVLLDRYGNVQLMQWLREGLPPDALASLR